MADMDIGSSSSDLGESGLAPGLVTADTSNVLPEINSSNNDVPNRKPTEDEIWARPNKEVKTNEPTKEPVQEAAAAEKEVVEEPVVEPEPTEVVEEEEPLVVEEDLSVAKLNQFAREIPELKAAFDKNPGVRNAMMAMARRSSKLGEYQALIPTPEAAKFAAENSEQFVQMNELFFSEDKASNVGFWDNLYQNSLVRDPVTNELVINNQTGQPLATGAYERVTGIYRNAVYNELAQKASKLGDDAKDELLKAIDVVKEHAGDGQRAQPQQQELSPEIQRRLADADRILEQNNVNRTEMQQEWGSSTVAEITTTLKTDIASHVKRMVDTQGIALTPYEQKKVVDDIYNEVNTIATNNKQYQSHFNSLAKRAPLTGEGRKSLVAEARKYAKEILPSAALKVIREATSQTVEKVQTASAKRAEQSNKKEVKTSGSAPTPAGPISQKDKLLELRAKKGRPLTEQEIMSIW